MRETRFSEAQIIGVLNEVESGKSVKDVCREHAISDATFYNWRAKYGGMELSQVKRLKELEQENRQLKHMYAELSLDHRILKDIVEKKDSEASREADTGSIRRQRTRSKRSSWVPAR